MKVCYNNLWKLLIDRGMRKKDLMEQTGLSPSTMAKLSSNENVNMDVLKRICEVLGVNIQDIMQFVEK